MGLAALGLPDTDAPIIGELARASDPNPITRVLADAALLELDRYATGQRLADAIDTVAAAAINAGARHRPDNPAH